MKYYILLILFTVGLFGQSNSGSAIVSIPKDMLTEQQITELNQQKLDRTIQHYTDWAKMGQAANGFVESLTDNSVEFLNSKPGKYLLFFIGWYVMGDKLIDVTIGTILFIIVMGITMYSYRKTCIPRSIVMKRSLSGKTLLGVFPMFDKEYQVINNGSDVLEGRIWHMIFSIIVIIAFAIIIFV